MPDDFMKTDFSDTLCPTIIAYQNQQMIRFSIFNRRPAQNCISRSLASVYQK
ncbi:hypothetical protein HMPREF3213_01453 [Heyndrickxia coagulans]|uniref:Uncharacterized protein n=1 Tax=Heyndrickxia coagulans TaxID=1398 RepID=A0A133KTQ8_HEYCO|nr:hypothetical protein HMPREF3213_01453 [Heyndrickxia coagulans]